MQYVRFANDRRPLQERHVGEYLLELDDEGSVEREIGLDGHGNVVHRWRWSDRGGEQPTSEPDPGKLSSGPIWAYDYSFAIGGEPADGFTFTLDDVGGHLIDQQEFERVWRESGPSQAFVGCAIAGVAVACVVLESSRMRCFVLARFDHARWQR